MIQLLGIAGNIAFGWACIPTAWATMKAGHSIGTPIGLAWNIFLACCLFYGYTLLQYTYDPILWICGLVEITSYGIVIWFHYRPRTP